MALVQLVEQLLSLQSLAQPRLDFLEMSWQSLPLPSLPPVRLQALHWLRFELAKLVKQAQAIALILDLRRQLQLVQRAALRATGLPESPSCGLCSTWST